MKKILVAASILSVLLLVAGCQKKQAETAVDSGEWVPQKDITFICGFEAGGAADIPARIVTKYMSKYSAKPVTVVNVVGAGGRTSAKQVQTGPGDGYTVLHVPVGWYMQKAMGLADFSYADFKQVALWCDSWVGLVVKGDSSYKTYADFIAAAKANPGKIKLGAVSGTLPVLAALAVQEKEGVEFNIVDLGVGAKAPELLSGRIDAYIDGAGATKPFVDSGEFRSLVIFSYDENIPGYSNVVTAKSLGYENFDYLLQSFGLWASAKTPPAAVDYISNLVKLASEDPECIKELNNIGYGAAYMPPDEYTAMCRNILEGTEKAVQPLLGK